MTTATSTATACKTSSDREDIEEIVRSTALDLIDNLKFNRTFDISHFMERSGWCVYADYLKENCSDPDDQLRADLIVNEAELHKLQKELEKLVKDPTVKSSLINELDAKYKQRTQFKISNSFSNRLKLRNPKTKRSNYDWESNFDNLASSPNFAGALLTWDMYGAGLLNSSFLKFINEDLDEHPADYSFISEATVFNSNRGRTGLKQFKAGLDFLLRLKNIRSLRYFSQRLNLHNASVKFFGQIENLERLALDTHVDDGSNVFSPLTAYANYGASKPKQLILHTNFNNKLIVPNADTSALSDVNEFKFIISSRLSDQSVSGYNFADFLRLIHQQTFPKCTKLLIEIGSLSHCCTMMRVMCHMIEVTSLAPVKELHVVITDHTERHAYDPGVFGNCYEFTLLLTEMSKLQCFRDCHTTFTLNGNYSYTIGG